MNYSSSSSLSLSSSSPSSSVLRWEAQNHIQPNQQEHQERDWLCCSTSTTATRIVEGAAQDASPQEEEDDNEEENHHHQKFQVDGQGGNNKHNNISSSSNINNYGVVNVEREHMFDKVVTPSDVGKLNRLVIPKQHAEKYFPLDSSNNNNNEKAGLLLNFQDLTGKSWRFRYSYWNSSQSYVMTKGWSRFVKEKKLCAGDIVSFQRAVCDQSNEPSKTRFYIDWRRRPPDHHHHHHLGTAYSAPATGSWTLLRSHPYEPHPWRGGTSVWDHASSNNTHLAAAPINMSMMSMVPYNFGSNSSNFASVVSPHSYPSSRGSSSLIFLSSSSFSSGTILSPSLDSPSLLPSRIVSAPSQLSAHCQEREASEPKVYDSVPIVQDKVGAKRSLRLFGVNMDCPPIAKDNDPNDSHLHQNVVSPSVTSSMGTTIKTPPSSSTQ